MSVIVDGDLTTPTPLGTPSVSYPIDNFTGLKYVSQEYACLVNSVPPPPLGERHHVFSNAVLAEQGQESIENGVLARFNRTYVEYPDSTLNIKRHAPDMEFEDIDTEKELELDPIAYHYTEPVQLTTTYPAFRYYDTYAINENTTNEEDFYSPVWKAKVPIRPTLSMSVLGIQTYRWINLLDDTYATYQDGEEALNNLTGQSRLNYQGQLYYVDTLDTDGLPIIRVSGVRTKLAVNQIRLFETKPSGFDIDKIPLKDKWSPRKLIARYTRNPSGRPIAVYETTDTKIKYVGSNYTRPSIQEYLQAKEYGVKVRAETTKVEKQIGIIYVIKETLVPLK